MGYPYPRSHLQLTHPNICPLNINLRTAADYELRIKNVRGRQKRGVQTCQLRERHLADFNTYRSSWGYEILNGQFFSTYVMYLTTRKRNVTFTSAVGNYYYIINDLRQFFFFISTRCFKNSEQIQKVEHLNKIIINLASFSNLQHLEIPLAYLKHTFLIIEAD